MSETNDLNELQLLRARVNELTEDKTRLMQITEKLDQMLQSSTPHLVNTALPRKPGKSHRIKDASSSSSPSDDAAIARLRAELAACQEQVEDLKFNLLYEGRAEKTNDPSRATSSSSPPSWLKAGGSSSTDSVAAVSLSSLNESERLALLHQWLWQTDLMQSIS